MRAIDPAPLKLVGRRLSFFLLAALTGALVGGMTVLLIQLILLVQWLGYGEASEFRFATIAATKPLWLLILIPTLGGLFVGVLMQFLPGRRYHGIADVMEACAMNSARMPMRSGLGAALAAGVSLGVGAPLGREGPAVHIGASLAAWVAERLKLDRTRSLALLGCGAAAAVTVSFNAPVAAVIFALEVIIGYYTLRVFAPIVIAAMAAVVVRHVWLGSEPMFGLPDYQIASLWELPLFALLGVVAALLARLLIALTGGTDLLWSRLHLPPWCRPAVAGFIIGALASQLPQILSIGVEPIVQAINGELLPTLIILLLLGKLVAVALALGSGFAGGVFGPAMFLGAMLGSAFWLLADVTGLPLSGQGVYALVGIGAVGSALLGAPISTVLIVFELTHDYGVTIGVMTASAMASTVMQFGTFGSFFRWQLGRRSIDIAVGRNSSLLMSYRVQKLVSDRYLAAPAACSVGELEALMGAEARRFAMIVDDDGALLGSVGLARLVSHAINTGTDGPALQASRSADYAVNASTNVVTALQLMADEEEEYLPVVDDAEPPRLLGIVLKSDVLIEHYDVVKRAREDEFGIV